jgi:SAM-dependent methyltransferase
MAAMYDAGVKHDRGAIVGAWAMWGADMRRMFADVARLADTPAGTSVLDIPCGGFAFRVLHPGRPVRYVPADISPHMLGRAREVARRMRTQDAIEFVDADVTALQFADNSFHLCVIYNGLHCLPDPRTALAELTRVLRPGGTLRGTSCVTGFAKRAFGAGEDGRELIESYPRAFTPKTRYGPSQDSPRPVQLSNPARLHPLLSAGPLLPVLLPAQPIAVGAPPTTTDTDQPHDRPAGTRAPSRRTAAGSVHSVATKHLVPQ